MVETVLVQVLLGVYLGVLTGIIPALVAWSMGFTFKYLTGFSVPGLGVVVLAAAMAGVSGGLMGLIDPAISSTWTGVTALLIVLMMSLWAHGYGDKLGANFPKRITLKSIRERTLSNDVIERVGSFGQARIRVSGPIGDMEDYPSIPEHLRHRIAADSWTFPADLSLAEMERRLTERLLTEYELAAVNVSIDDAGRATLSAAPAPGGLSRRLPSGRRAVSIETLVPTGVATGDEVTIRHADGEITGTVVGVKPADSIDSKTGGSADEPIADGARPADDVVEPTGDGPARAPTAAGGRGRITLSVTQRDARTLLGADVDGVLVRARGKRREYELLSLLKKSGNKFRKIRVKDGAPIADVSLGEGRIRDTYDVVILAIRRPTERIVGPRGDTMIRPGDDLYVVGSREAVTAFEGAVA